MVTSHSLYDFPVRADHRFWLNGRRYRIGASGVRTLKTLVLIYSARVDVRDSNWAISVRPQIREIHRCDRRSTLSYVLDRTQDPILRILAIWLRGLCRGTIGKATVARLATYSDFQTRKEVARALKRMSDWPTLKTMAADDPSPRIRLMATCNPPRPVAGRIARFMRETPYAPVRLLRKPVFMATTVGAGDYKPPKSAVMIRSILERIRRLVGGER